MPFYKKRVQGTLSEGGGASSSEHPRNMKMMGSQDWQDVY